MPKQVHNDVLDGSLNAVKTVATKELLISGYTLGDSYATVNANKISEVTVASADFTLATSGSNRTLTSAVKSSVATAASAEIAAGTASGGSTTTMADTGAGWTTNDKAGKVVTIVSGTGSGQSAIITSNTSDTLTFPALATAPDATSVYRINNNHHIAFTNGVDKVLWVTDETGNAAVEIGDTTNFPALLLTNPAVV